MPPDSSFQDSVDKTRDAFRRAVPEGHDPAAPLEWHAPHADQSVGRGDASASHVGGYAGLHPFFRGLLDTLPEPGAEWPRPKREQWLETARSIFALIYADPAETAVPLRLNGAPDSGRGAAEPDRYSA